MVLLLGASGFVGRAFARELRRRGHGFIPLTRRGLDYTNFELLFDYVRRMRPRFLINAAGLTGPPDGDAGPCAGEALLAANTLLPQTIARVCAMTRTAWGHVSSGCIFSGATILDQGRRRFVPDLTRPEFQSFLAEQPEHVLGFTEWDEPNFSFRHPPCSFYSGSKVLAEEALREAGQLYLWRPGIVFNEQAEPGNYLWQLQQQARIYPGVSPLSHVDDFARACLSLWEREAAFGIYHVVNPGIVTTNRVVGMIRRALKPARAFEFWTDEESRRHAAGSPRCNCVLATAKLRGAGVELRPVAAALADALRHWQPAPDATRPARSARRLELARH
jgi:dTDP-4-dehydrorhamnose reductase